MTADELTDLRSIAATVRRIEEKQQQDSTRLDRLEKFADKAEGAITLAKFVLSLVGIGGVAALLAAVAQH